MIGLGNFPTLPWNVGRSNGSVDKLLDIELAIFDFDKVVVFLCKLFRYVAILSFRNLVEIARIVIANQIDLITSPPAGKLGVLQVDIPTSPFITLSQQVGEDSSSAVRTPFPEFG